MPHEGSITPADLVGKLDWLVVSCEECGRHGRYNVARLVERIGADAKLTDYLTEVITADCLRRKSIDMSDQCGARCPDVPKVFSGSIDMSDQCSAGMPELARVT
jgi:hypothetical protein